MSPQILLGYFLRSDTIREARVAIFPPSIACAFAFQWCYREYKFMSCWFDLWPVPFPLRLRRLLASLENSRLFHGFLGFPCIHNLLKVKNFAILSVKTWIFGFVIKKGPKFELVPIGKDIQKMHFSGVRLLSVASIIHNFGLDGRPKPFKLNPTRFGTPHCSQF
jgi:hypothetical protein